MVDKTVFQSEQRIYWYRKNIDSKIILTSKKSALRTGMKLPVDGRFLPQAQKTANPLLIDYVTLQKLQLQNSYFGTIRIGTRMATERPQ